MVTQVRVAGIPVDVVFKDIKNVHLSVYPPTGRIRVSAPKRMTLETVRLFAVSKIAWIRKHQEKINAQKRETPREFLERESHYVWGRRYLLKIQDADRPSVSLSARHLELKLPESDDAEARKEILSDWYREQLRDRASPLVSKWSCRLDVEVDRFFVQRMKTKWGSSSPSRRTIRLNLELARLAPECLDYVILHELAHFLVPNHSPHFIALLDKHMPGWRSIRDKLNEGPLSAYE